LLVYILSDISTSSLAASGAPALAAVSVAACRGAKWKKDITSFRSCLGQKREYIAVIRDGGPQGERLAKLQLFGYIVV
jgi:hypothetical protein